ncbi:hypothetical protein [Halomarina oriensis]|uniref:Uncharacterized protein n=1 Tax=Halomarina oriensis TaxID=671145 RepID=A0A6B0GQY1_9EURY|nr:hypothetical protein [Halomarina oriensis]MWG36491.1 hypothetical protein [Halomarina oriensis]
MTRPKIKLDARGVVGVVAGLLPPLLLAAEAFGIVTTQLSLAQIDRLFLFSAAMLIGVQALLDLVSYLQQGLTITANVGGDSNDDDP